MKIEGITDAALADTRSLLGLVLNDLFDGVYIVDRSRKIIFWNSAAERITGHKRTEVLGRRCSDGILNHIDEKGNRLCNSAGCPLIQTLARGTHQTMKVFPLAKDKRRVPVQTHVSPIKNSRGEIVAAIEIFRDISAEEKYRLVEEKFARLVKKHVSRTAYEDMRRQASQQTTPKSQKRDLTILFIDVVGFTPMSEQLPHAEIVGVLNSLFSICEKAMEKHHGDIDKFIGDAALGVFVDAQDAVAAAEEILRRLETLNSQRKRRKLPPIQVRIGLSSGTVVQGDIGGASRKDLTV
ncbi:MAG TPA: adenylate/guanylate cyclase domain-containing protein, partial [Elusimicrobiales bacterium]|nr:adenylate/guanylate cyclase domain-containing protein [Elusimicrobiales bacterium]